MTIREENSRCPLISIGMPVYNGGKYIRQALDSLLAQTCTDFEIIISDNASTDATEATCREYAVRDTRIRYVRQSKNQGASANFRFVLNEAVGKYFMWAAADDYWSSNWLEVLLHDFTRDTALAFGHVVPVTENGMIIERFKHQGFSKIRFVWLLQHFLREEFYYKANFMYGLYEREELLKFSFGETYGADNHFVFEVIQRGRLSTNPNALFYKRTVASSEAFRVKEASSGFLRKMFLIDLLPYYAVYPRIADSYLLKVIILVLLPVKYLKTLCFLSYRKLSYVNRRMAGFKRS